MNDVKKVMELLYPAGTAIKIRFTDLWGEKEEWLKAHITHSLTHSFRYILDVTPEAADIEINDVTGEHLWEDEGKSWQIH